MNRQQRDELIEERIKLASTQTKSDDDVVQIAWLADGIDLWHRSGGERGHSPAEARRYIISSITRLVDSAVLEAENNARYLLHSILSSDVDSELDHSDIEEMFVEGLQQSKQEGEQ